MNRLSAAVPQRLARVRAAIEESDAEALLVNHLPNVQYLTGFRGSNGWLLLTDSDGLFFTDGRYKLQAEEELDESTGFDLLVPQNGILDALADHSGREFAGKRILFEGRHLSFADSERLMTKASSVEWDSCADLVEALRAVKDEEEITAISKAAELAATALEGALNLVEPGIRELDVAAELDYRMRRLGASGPAFDTIVATGERSALPHASTSENEIRNGDLLLCDLGALWKGYRSDLTRTFVVGEAQPRQTEVYQAVIAAQRAALTVLEEGASASHVDAAARASFAELGLEPQFLHSTGHGIGLEVHEGPRLNRHSDQPLKSNMVVTLEPGLYFAGWGGVRIEDDVVVTPGEPRFLVDLPRDELRVLSP